MLSVCVNEWVSEGVLSGMECTLKPSYFEWESSVLVTEHSPLELSCQEI